MAMTAAISLKIISLIKLSNEVSIVKGSQGW
jgi:hypothetical protein